jgi:S-adenosylmethionine decarboxylase proenzyme
MEKILSSFYVNDKNIIYSDGEVGATGRFMGRHLVAEFYGVDEQSLNNEQFLSSALADAILLSGAVLLGMQSRRFEPVGVTILALLAESHASIHTYPENQSMFLDIFTCGTCRPEESLKSLVNAIQPKTWESSEIIRGRNPKKDEVEI